MEIKMIEEGLLIPKSVLNELGIDDFEVLTRGREILVRPKTVTKQCAGFVGEEEYDEEFISQMENAWAARGDD